ncbi:MAG: metallophosphoesterase [Chryseolinea sp.]
MNKIIYCLLLLASSLHLSAQSITGYVFEDRNKNGTKENNEPGIKGVAVSDQQNVVVTDETGQYTIANKGYGIISISMPDGYSAKTFWQNATTTFIHFALTRKSSPSTFQFIHASDTHISETSINRMDKFRAIADSVNPDLVLITGDLVKDALRVDEKEATHLYQLFASESAKIKSAVWLAPGNHEIFGIERHLSLVSEKNPLYGRNMYRHFFGPDYYSFNYGGVHFISLNSLEFEDLWYYGRIDSTQMEWLKKDLAVISKSMPIVTFQHVPFYSGGMTMENFTEEGPGRSLEREHGVMQFRHVVSNADEVMTTLKPYNFVLSLAGHYHFRQLFSIEGINTRFEQTAAVIAPVQTPYTTLPSGVTVYKVVNGKIDAGQFIPLDEKK